MDISAPTTIFLRHGKVLYVVVLISRGSSNSTIFLSAEYPLESLATLQYYPFYFFTFYPSSQ
jgi:hypothetical protein